MQPQFSREDIADFIESQLAIWPLAKMNYDALAKVERHEIKLGDYEFFVQFNPARIVSTGANVEKEKISQRKCFLCGDNRPAEQMKVELLSGWDMLVNPYPIFPVHLTLASQKHVPQNSVPKDIVEIALRLPGMAVFFNGAKAGASAPDHLHLQAVLKDELPLIRLIEKIHPHSAAAVLPSDALLPGFPFLFFSGVVSPDEKGMKILLAGLSLGGSETEDGFFDHQLVNAFFWLGEGGNLRYIVVPRKAHRPACFYRHDGSHMMISPGCVDMAGVIITPRREDYSSLTPDNLSQIYKDVAFRSRENGRKN